MTESRLEKLVAKEETDFIKGITGADSTALVKLAETVSNILEGIKAKKKLRRASGAGAKGKVPVADWVMMLYMYYYIGHGHEFIGKLLGVNNGTVSRNFKMIDPIVCDNAKLPEPYIGKLDGIVQASEILERFENLDVVQKKLNPCVSACEPVMTVVNGISVLTVQRIGRIRLAK